MTKTPSYAILGYPKLSSRDEKWIRDLRVRFDELYGEFVEPHVTFVFPLQGLEAPRIAEHMRAVARDLRPVPFVLRCALIVKDAFREHTHIFLVPDEGFAALVRIHTRLYTGDLRRFLRLEIPYIPHLGIANSLDAQECKDVADDLNETEIEIPGVVRSLDLVRLQGRTLETLVSVPLKDGEPESED